MIRQLRTEMQTANKQMKRCTPSQAVMEIQVKRTQRCYFSLIRLGKIIKYWWHPVPEGGRGSHVVLTLLVGAWAATVFWDNDLRCLLKFKMWMPFDPANPLWRIYPAKPYRHIKQYIQGCLLQKGEKEEEKVMVISTMNEWILGHSFYKILGSW